MSPLRWPESHASLCSRSGTTAIFANPIHDQPLNPGFPAVGRRQVAKAKVAKAKLPKPIHD